MVEFNDSLTRLGCDLARVRLLRHDTRGLVAWRRGGETAFGCWASFQKKAPSPCSGPMDLACHFLPGPTVGDGAATRLFVGATRILDRWDWDRLRRPRILEDVILASEAGRAALEAFDLEWPATVRTVLVAGAWQSVPRHARLGRDARAFSKCDGASALAWQLLRANWRS